ncbi:YkvA family protein [Arenimonas oryziterrae]|uniref:DUF1232 domain-containing protein n=1 Tax=Arenimonas oryziterrae DSM 21050 = YC6267 TaxID=1121015 RepID=A0A091AWL1_9GAMM|nr:DUF1232 domain-containing protein [Arenimonas oryziterrae]KFN43039.1 hypothetical protein N789_10785 [Arenimonas oryziterrae DSM 21050 = YC6267]
MTRVSLRTWARALKQQTLVIYFVARNPKTPWPVRLLALLIAAYALSPIDLIPDFIPVIGYLDDLILIPLGLAWVIRLTPPDIVESSRAQAQRASQKPVSYPAAAFILVLWLVLLGWHGRWLLGIVHST